MYLKSLTLRGFKSFASATTLRFEPGITCVVGPNGSGKSNVVDALAWVMGEHSAKSLRGGKMEDVIFAGTSSRPPLGRAEVTLTIDNTDGALPIDYSEVTISRLMFRSGQSEYAINGDTCRLLDIQELLSDSGIGREMHVIVGQGQLDQVLHAGPEERRAFIEEAAGVLKHRKRKEKALRKLDAMQANLTRVEDLVTELRRRLKPLGRQAEIARRAAVIQADLRDARLRLLADDTLTLSDALRREEADEAAIQARRAEVEAELAEGQRQQAGWEAAEREVQPRLKTAQETFYRLSALRERLRGVEGLAAERQRHATATVVERRGRDPDELEREAAEVREREQALTEELDQAREQLTVAVDLRMAAEEALADEERRLTAAARAAADRREALARLRGQVESARGRVRAAEEEIGRLLRALEDAQSRAERAQAEHDARQQAEPTVDPELAAGLAGAQEGVELARVAVREAQAVVERAQDAVEREQAALVAPRTALAAAQRATAAARDADQESQRVVAALQARCEALELSLAGGADGAGALLGAKLPGMIGPLAAALTVESGAEAAIAAVLPVDGVVVDSPNTAVTALEYLHEADGGRASLLISADPDSTGPDRAVSDGAGLGCAGPDPGGRNRLGPPPVAGTDWAGDLITVPVELRPVVNALLADVVVVPDLITAQKVLESHPGLRAVTRSGDVLGAHVAQGGSGGSFFLPLRGALDEAAASLAAARAEAVRQARTLAEAIAAEQQCQRALEEAQARVDEAHTVVAAAQSGAHAAQRELESAQAVLDRLRGRQRDADAQAAAEARHLARLEAAVKAARGEVARLATAVQEAEQARELAQTGVVELAERLAEEEYAAELMTEPATDTRDELAARCGVARQAEMAAHLAVRTTEERVAGIAGRAEELLRAAQQERAERARAAAERERRRQQARTAAAVAHGAQVALQALDESLARAAAEHAATEQARGEIEAELTAVRQRVRDLSAELDALVNRAHGSEVARTERRLRLEQLQQRALEEFGLEPEPLIAEYGPAVPVPGDPPVPYVREEQERRARTAERQLAQLGKVNPLALEEFAALEERHAFLTTQLEDLKRTRRDLLLVVKEIDERVEQVFAAAYADVANEFERIFQRVFPGGEGRLRLTDPSDMLTTGVEVEARPPGKKVKRLSLLSGGERSLTAVAFLISIFTARPSPFYVMDEVEAALDDTNTQRLLTLFEELRRSSQLIVITHQKRTMEIADALYGVSMRGDGVSQVVSQRLRQRA